MGRGLDVMWNFSSIGKSMSIVFAHSWFDLYSTVVITLCACHLHAETYRSVHLGRQKYEKVKVELKFRFFFPTLQLAASKKILVRHKIIL